MDRQPDFDAASGADEEERERRTRFQLTIDRAVWLRGADAEDGRNSFLLRPSDGKRCCVGIYLSALGVPDELLSGESEDGGVVVPCEDDEYETRLHDLVPSWLADECFVYRINDDSKLSESEREVAIAERFAENGVDITFVGE